MIPSVFKKLQVLLMFASFCRDKIVFKRCSQRFISFLNLLTTFNIAHKENISTPKLYIPI